MSARPDIILEAAASEQAPLAYDEKLAWLRLSRTRSIGSVTFWELLAHFGNAVCALDALPQFAKLAKNGIAASSREAAEAEIEAADAFGLRLVALGEPAYPPLLAQVEVPPPLLYVKGDASIWNRPPIAVVGSRAASAGGLKLASEWSAELAADGFAIVSGLARGIDAAAHRAALPWGTVAVLAGGLASIYPPMNEDLALHIQANGILISECAPGYTARAQDFPRRNRIISGSSLGVLVVEAAERSGSLITARLSSEQNREVFAVPGSPLDARAAGTNGLLKAGAVVATSPQDIKDALRIALRDWKGTGTAVKLVTELADAGRTRRHDFGLQGASLGQDGPMPSADLGDAAQRIAAYLSHAPVDIDDLTRICGMSAREVSAALLTLDLAGRLDRPNCRLVSLKD